MKMYCRVGGRKLYFLSWFTLPLACQDILILVDILVLLIVLQLVNRGIPEQKSLPSHPHPNVHQNHREGITELKCRLYPLCCQHGLDTSIQL